MVLIHRDSNQEFAWVEIGFEKFYVKDGAG